MTTTTSAIPRAPPSPAAVVTASSLPMAPADMARAIDFVSSFLTRDMRIHADDLNELKTSSSRVRNSSNL